MNPTKAIPSLGDRVAATILVAGQPVKIEGVLRVLTVSTTTNPALYGIVTDSGERHNNIPAADVTLIKRGERMTIPSARGGTVEIGETA